jgi:hypothetical protein
MNSFEKAAAPRQMPTAALGIGTMSRTGAGKYLLTGFSQEKVFQDCEIIADYLNNTFEK